MSNAKVLVAQLGARKHYQEPLLFHRWDILDELYTDFYSGHSGVVNLLRYPRIYEHLPNFLKKSLDRYEPGLKSAKIIHFPRWGYECTQNLQKASPQQVSQIFVQTGQEFCRQIIQRGLGNANTIYGFNSACLELFEYAKDRGIHCILDQTFVDWSLAHQLLLAEEQQWTGWSSSPFTVNDGDLQLMQREHREQDLADQIICGSSFVRDSLVARGVDAKKISVVPLGRLKDQQLIPCQSVTQTPKERGDGLRILFIGAVGLRKGIPYLLAAIRELQGKIPFTCKVVGSLEIKYQRASEYSDVCEFLGKIPRSQIPELYTWADVFVLPSLCEGSAMVTYESLISGVPVITTYNSGSVVRDSVDGFIVPIRNTELIVEKLLKIYTMGNQYNLMNNTQEYLKKLLNDSENKLLQIVDKKLC